MEHAVAAFDVLFDQLPQQAFSYTEHEQLIKLLLDTQFGVDIDQVMYINTVTLKSLRN